MTDFTKIESIFYHCLYFIEFYNFILEYLKSIHCYKNMVNFVFYNYDMILNLLYVI